MILLTDGNNEWYDYPGITWTVSGQQRRSGVPGANAYPTNLGGFNYQNHFRNTLYPSADYTAYGRLSEGRLGTTSQSAANTILDNRMLAMCTAMKAQNIQIYTMTFGGAPDSGTQTLFTNCATEPDMYYNAPTAGQLQEAFEQIADELSNLRIAE